ncbi:glutathione s-transferase [Aspergillus sp. HF37]|nr:glutathione s-transferase [Aspergillus sp. HF37]
MDSSPPTPTLHHLAHSQSIRVLFALEEFGLPYHLKAYQRVKGRAPPELRDLFPLGKSPILEIPPTESESGPLRHVSTNPNPGTDRTVVTESRLILHHLADHYAPGLCTSNEDAARNTYFEEFAMCTLAPLVERILIFDLIPSATPLLVRPITWSLFYPFAWLFKKDLDAPLAVMEDALSTQEWFSGRELGIADLCLVFPMDVAAQRGWLAKRKSPRVQGWLARMHGRDGYQRAVAKSGGYDLKMFGM